MCDLHVLWYYKAAPPSMDQGIGSGLGLQRRIVEACIVDHHIIISSSLAGELESGWPIRLSRAYP